MFSPMIQGYPDCNKSKIMTGTGIPGEIADTVSAIYKIVAKPILTPFCTKWLSTVNSVGPNLYGLLPK